MKNDYLDDKEIERTVKIIEIFTIKNGEKLTKVYLKNDVLLLADVFENFIKASLEEFDVIPSNCVSLPGYTWQCGVKCTGIQLETLQDKELFLGLEKNNRSGISSVVGDRYVKST